MKVGFLLVLGCALGVACGQDNTLTQGAQTPVPTAPWATPSGTPVVPTYVGPLSTDCVNTGNANFQTAYVPDPDDPPMKGDALECVWLCAINPDISLYTPSEIIQVWDFDPPAQPTQYQNDPAVLCPDGLPCPEADPCNSWVP